MTNGGLPNAATPHDSTILAMSDETFLEAFIESISTLPHDVRRNLELLKDMDANCS
jgi:hypothetical protein